MYEIFADLCERHGVTPYRVAKDLKFSNVLLSDWKRKDVPPKADRLLLIARYFGVSVDYLLTGKEPNPATDLPYLTDQEFKKHIEMMWKLPKDRLKTIFEMIEAQTMFAERELEETRKKDKALG